MSKTRTPAEIAVIEQQLKALIDQPVRVCLRRVAGARHRRYENQPDLVPGLCVFAAGILEQWPDDEIEYGGCGWVVVAADDEPVAQMDTPDGVVSAWNHVASFATGDVWRIESMLSCSSDGAVIFL